MQIWNKILSLALVLPFAASDYMCVFSDRQGNLSERVTSREVAKTCDNCKCEKMEDVACIFGPDNANNYMLRSISNSQSQNCDRVNNCYCSSHDPINFFSKVKEILKEAEKKNFSVIGDKSEYEEPNPPPTKDPLPLPITDDFDYMCSFGVDANGKEVEGIITQLEHSLLCNSVEKKDFCDECTINIVTEEDPVVFKAD